MIGVKSHDSRLLTNHTTHQPSPTCLAQLLCNIEGSRILEVTQEGTKYAFVRTSASMSSF